MCTNVNQMVPTVNKSGNNIFSIKARQRLVELNLNITELAAKVKHPRSTVSKAIHSGRFPNVRMKVAKKLNLTHFV